MKNSVLLIFLLLCGCSNYIGEKPEINITDANKAVISSRVNPIQKTQGCSVPYFNPKNIQKVYFPEELMDKKAGELKNYILYNGERIYVDIADACKNVILEGTRDILEKFPKKCFFLISEMDYWQDFNCAKSNGTISWICSNNECFKFIYPELYDVEDGQPLFDENTGKPL